MKDDRKSTDTASEAATGTAPDKVWQSVPYSTAQIWRSKISWRITLAVFVTILLVQTLVLIFTARAYEAEQLNDLRENARAVLSASLEPAADQMSSPLSDARAHTLITDTVLNGIVVYSLDYRFVRAYGEPTFLQPRSAEDIGTDHRSADNSRYEVVFAASDVGKPYNIVARLDAASVEPRVVAHIRQSLTIFSLMAGFVTSVLMLVLSQWLLEPILLLRNNMVRAARNPENSEVEDVPKDTDDEIGTTIRIANNLIRQNASNLKRLRTQAEDRIHKLAYFDGLTGLPNRTYFLEKLEENIRQRVMEDEGRMAVLAVDIDNFKDINDTMGHDIGDRLLDAVGKRLVKCLPEGTIVARASADEFTVMVHLRGEHTDSSALVDRIFSAMTEPVSVTKERFQVRVSVGVAHCPDDGIDARQILKNADIALNRAKQEGRDTVRYYSQDFDLAIQQRFQLLRDLRIAMDQKQLLLHYHPQFDLKTNQIVGVEALIRWWRPDNSKAGGKFISPADFIPVAEQSGLIVPIGEYVLRTACEANRRWQALGLAPFRMAVNISSIQFHRGDIVGLVDTVLKETGLSAKWLELEVTEGAFMENIQTAIDLLDRLHELGVELAVDDFGTGYSSLSYLRQFPIDRLKVDQSFIKNALSNVDDRTIVKTIITLGHNLGLKVIAEGVETGEHENFLHEEGCDEAQGFKYSKPLPEDQLLEFIAAHNRALAKNGGGLSLVES